MFQSNGIGFRKLTNSKGTEASLCRKDDEEYFVTGLDSVRVEFCVEAVGTALLSKDRGLGGSSTSRFVMTAPAFVVQNLSAETPSVLVHYDRVPLEARATEACTRSLQCSQPAQSTVTSLPESRLSKPHLVCERRRVVGWSRIEVGGCECHFSLEILPH